MTQESCFLQPLDTLVLRGNKLFGDPGSYGEALMPPWPSVAAGALRSAMLARDGHDLAAFGRGQLSHPELGTPESPGSFELQGFQLARLLADGRVELLWRLPADLIVDGASKSVHGMKPTALSALLETSAPLPLLPVLAQTERSKPTGGYWLTHAGWLAYLAGRIPAFEQLIHGRELWQLDMRVGVGLDPAKRSAEDGKLFSTQAVLLRDGVGFAVKLSGASLANLGLLRLGGEGRSVSLSRPAIAWPEPDYAALTSAGKCRVVLTTPGLFADGWRLPGMTADGLLRLPGLTARVSCAALGPAEVISGFDMAKRAPKAAQRAVAAGSVYWLDDMTAEPEALRKLAESGFWPPGDNNEIARSPRRAEGFNRCTLAA
jgi:CRISPR-associated protein Cmr3